MTFFHSLDQIYIALCYEHRKINFSLALFVRRIEVSHDWTKQGTLHRLFKSWIALCTGFIIIQCQ